MGEGAHLLWISNLSEETTAKEIKKLCNKHGKVVLVKVVTSARSSSKNRFSSVMMASLSDVINCIKKLQGTELHGRVISLEKARCERHQKTLCPEDVKSSKDDRLSQKERDIAREKERSERRRAACLALRERKRKTIEMMQRLAAERKILRAEREQIEREKTELLRLERKRLEVERIELQKVKQRLEKDCENPKSSDKHDKKCDQDDDRKRDRNRDLNQQSSSSVITKNSLETKKPKKPSRAYNSNKRPYYGSQQGSYSSNQYSYGATYQASAGLSYWGAPIPAYPNYSTQQASYYHTNRYLQIN